MNKKIIKYLIWTIIIAAVLILMPTKQIMALEIKTVTRVEFEESKNLFCLNKGLRFYGAENYYVHEFDDSMFKNVAGKEIDKDVLEYIICESTNGIYGDRTKIGDYTPQIAIWLLLGVDENRIKKGISSEKLINITYANQLINKAYAYKAFVEAGSPIPHIKKEGTDKIIIEYYQTSYEEQTYSNLLIDSIDVNGATFKETVKEGNYYKNIYTANKGATNATVSFDYEASRTIKDLKIYDAIENTNKLITTYSYGDDEEKEAFEKLVDKDNGNESYHHVGCNGFSEECYNIDTSDLENSLGNLYRIKYGDKFFDVDAEKVKNCNSLYTCGNPDHCLLGFDSEENPMFFYPDPATDYMGTYVFLDSANINNIKKEEQRIYIVQNLLYGDGKTTIASESETIELKQPVKLNFNKIDFNGKSVSGANLKVEAVDNVEKINPSSILIGNASLTVTPKNGNSGTFKIKLTETAPAGYQGMPQTTLTVAYNNGQVSGITSSNTTYVPNSNNSDITIKNKPQIDKLTLLKVDSQNNATKIGGATFKITLTNVESVGKYSVGGNKSGTIVITGIKTAQNGELYIEDLVIEDTSKDVTIIIEETSSILGYKRMEGKIKLTVRRNGANYSVHKSEIIGNVLPTEYQATNAIVNNHKIALTIKNIPVMNLGGIVWEDTQSGDKVVAGPDGKYNNNEEGMAGIKVELYKPNGSKVTKDAYGNNLMTKTSSGENLNYALYNGRTSSITLAKGQYLFANIEKGNYYVEFTYDGINYKTVDLSEDVIKEISTNYLYEYNLDKDNNHIDISKTTEMKTVRDAFNAKFTTISSGKATGSKGDIALLYSDSTEEGATVKTSSLITKDSQGNVLPNYEMKARSGKGLATNTYLKPNDNWKTVCWNDNGTIKTDTYAQDINCGLTYRKFDLALGMDIDSAKLTINGKDTTYSYNQIIDSGLTDPNNDLTLDEWLNGNISSTVKNEELPTYNLYLYTSDYNYRIDDYKTDLVFNAGVTSSDDSSKIKQSETDTNKELRAFITYKVILKNQTTQQAKINELAYYYDKNYTFVSATKADGTAINFTNDSSLPQINGKTSARVSGFASALGKDSNYRQELYFTFEVKKDENRFLVKDIECANLVEILSYTTDKGLIDNDSAPGNIVSNGSIRFEDDTDKAKGIKLTISEERETRTIEGTVFEDTKTEENQKYNGQKDDGEQGVNNVIVQLIEIKKIGNVYYEYIWQETKSGSSEVKTTARNGYGQQTYTNSVTEEQIGRYEFKEFIPGNYIIRFIYGDGRTYDITDNVKKYNGQDYKSTTDPNYKKLWYNTAGYVAGDSVARDNEARRLEIMAYSSTINGTNGAELANKTSTALDKTWMCAETSRINIPVDDVENAKTETLIEKTDSTTASYWYTKDKTKVLFGDMNFGLSLRPQTKLALEKHITALKITPSGTGVLPIVDAKALSIEKIINENQIDIQGITTGLATIKSTEANRGFWQVATDVEELMQGAELEVEYTYVIRNDSEKDYLNKNVLTEYYNNIGKDVNTNGTDDYAEYLKGASDSVDTTMKNGAYSYSSNNSIGTYLGQFYYTGNIADNDQLVLSRVDNFKEALNNDLIFNESQTASFKIAEQQINKPVYGVDKSEGTKDTTIDTVIVNSKESTFLLPKSGETYNVQTEDTIGSADWSKTVKLTTTLATVSGGELGANLPSYIAEIIQYSNAAGRKDMTATPANLGYVHSDDTTMTLNAYVKKDENGKITDIKYEPTEGYEKINEQDEFWAESIIITKPTGEDKLTPIQTVIIAISATAILGVGIVLIKKYILKK